MADRRIKVILSAQITDFKRQMDEAAKSTKKVGEGAEQSSTTASTALGRLTRSAQDNRQAWDRAGTALSVFGAGTVAALGFATKAAVDWESAWAGVTKTVDGSAAQMAALESGLREMARTLPASHTEIAAVAEAAGQLGVQTDSILSFTRTMIDLGETTNLSADEAATAIARFTNVMGTSDADVGRLGSSVVELGNNFATTEAEIVAMSQRLSAAGAIAGFTEPQVLGLATAMSSIGIEAEAGGSAMSQVIQAISKAVADGGADVETFARLAQMSAQSFTDAWKSDPIVALDAVVGGLASMNATGGNSYAVLSDLGLAGIRQTQVLQGLATATGLTTSAVEMASSAWAQNTALIEEAGQRYDTAEAKLQVAKNSIHDAAITLGQTFLPIVAQGAEAVADLAQWFGSLPAPVQSSLAVIGGLVGVTALAAGGFLKLFPRVLDTIEAFRTLKADGSALPGVLGKVGKAAGVAGLALAVVVPLLSNFEGVPEGAVASVSQMTKALLDLENGTESLDALFGKGLDANPFVADINSLDDAINRIANPSAWNRVNDVIAEVFTLTKATGDVDLEASIESLKVYGEALAFMATSGHAEQAAAGFDLVASKWAATGKSLDDLRELMPAYTAVVDEADATQALAADSATDLAASLGYAGQMSQEAADALADWRQMVADASASFIDLSGAFDAVIAKNTEVAKATAEATKSSKDSWEDYYDGVSVSAEDYIAELQAQVAAQQNWQENLLALNQRTMDSMSGETRVAAQEMVDELIDMGADGAELVALFNSMTDEQLVEVVANWSQRGAEIGEALADGIDAARNPQITIEAGSELATEQLDTLLGVIAAAEGTVTIDGDMGPAGRVLGAATASIDHASGTVTIYGEDGEGVITLSDFTSEVDHAGGTVTIYGKDDEGRETVATLTKWIGHQGEPVLVGANTKDAYADVDALIANLAKRTAVINIRGQDVTPNSGGTSRPGFAEGGAVFGAGTETSDSIAAWLSNGEHVWSAAEVRGAGGHTAVANLRAAARTSTAPAFAAGGSPGYTEAALRYSTHAPPAGATTPAVRVVLPSTLVVRDVDGALIGAMQVAARQEVHDGVVSYAAMTGRTR